MVAGRPRARLVVALLVLGALLLVAQAIARPKDDGRGAALRRASERIERWRHRTDPHAFRDQLESLASAEDLDAAIEDLSRNAMLRAADMAELSSYPWWQEGEGLLLPAGDLTADGGEDAIEWYWGDGLDAVRGTNGATLWGGATGSFMVPLLAGPLDTQVGDDLVLLSISSRNTTGRRILTLRYEAVQGNTGNMIWSRTFDSQISGVKVGPTGATTQLDLALPHAAADLNGDGALDLVIARYNGLFVKDPGTGLREMRTAAAFESVSGKDGRPFGEALATGRSFFPDATLVPDLNGDGLQDLVTASYQRAGGGVEARFTAFPGKGGAPIWTQAHTFEDVPYLQGADLNGDGKGDVAVEVSSGWYWFPPSTTIAAVSGANGEVLWSRHEDGGIYTLPAGNADGQGGEDLYAISYFSYFYCPGPPFYGYGYGGYGGYGYGGYGSPPPYGYAPPTPYGYGFSASSAYPSPPPYGYGYGGYGYGYGYYGYGGYECDSPPDVSMISGSTGMPLWSYSNTGLYSYTEPVGDATGDGVGDILETWYEYDPAQGLVERSLLLSGGTGASVWTASAPWSYLFGLYADFDGDGGNDLLRLDFQQSEDRYAVVSGATGQQLWDLVGPRRSYLAWIDTASLDGDGLADLLETAYSYAGGWWDSFTAARRGADGERLWRRG